MSYPATLAKYLSNNQSKAILVVGTSGSGKTTSIGTMPADSTAIINTERKSLPFNKKIPNFFVNDYQEFAEVFSTLLREPTIKSIVIDDYNTLHSFMFKMLEDGIKSRIEASSKTGKIEKQNGFELYGDLKDMATTFINQCKTCGKNIIFLCLAEKDDNGNFIPLIDGKFKAKLYSMFTVAVSTDILMINDRPIHCFKVINEGDNAGKVPAGMLDKYTAHFAKTHGLYFDDNETVLDNRYMSNNMAHLLTGFINLYKEVKQNPKLVVDSDN